MRCVLVRSGTGTIIPFLATFGTGYLQKSITIKGEKDGKQVF